MKYDRYISLIQRLEVQAAKNRSVYQFKVFLLTVLGYAYFVGLILLVLVPIVFILGLFWLSPSGFGRVLLYTAKLWWVLIPGIGLFFSFIGSAIKSVTAKVPDPEGIELLPSAVPELYLFVESTCKKLRSKRPSKILITDTFNAAVVTMPRFGIFGQKVLLLVGLPVMKALSSEQLEAVLADEIGHISGNHGVFTKWAYQMREAWGRLIESEEAVDHKFAALYKQFVDWFFPYFTAYSFVLMREHEKDADRDAAMLVGVKQLGEALILLETKGRSLDEDFWVSIHKENIESETPSEKLFSRMIGSLAFVNEERSMSALSDAITVPTDLNDTHPSLADRLRLIEYWTKGELPAVPGIIEKDAATAFLGASVNAFTSQFDSSWDSMAVETWKQRHEHFREVDTRIRELEEKRTSGSELTLEELREIGRLLTEREGVAAAIPAIEEAAERFPEEAVVWYNLGLARLSQNDDAGLAHLDRAVELDPHFKFESDQLAFGYLRGKGRIEEAKRYANSMDEQQEVYENAQKERTAAFPGEKFEVHDLPQESIDAIPGKLQGLEEINALYAVNKVVKYMPEFPYRVLFLDLRKKGRIRNRHDSDPTVIFQIVKDRLDTGEFHYFALLAGKWAGTKYELERIPGAKIYKRPPQ